MTSRDRRPSGARPCSIAAALEVVGERWALLVVREVGYGNHRFAQIVRNTGAPRDRVSARLKSLVELGILEQRQYQSNPPRSDYHLSAAGQALGPVLVTLREWGDRWVAAAPTIRTLHRDHELTLGGVCSVCHETIRRSDVTREMTAPGWEMAGPVP